MDWTSRRSTIMEVQGSMVEAEVQALYNLAKKSTSPIVEIGSLFGLSTCSMGYGTLDGNNQPVFAIDPHIDVRIKHGVPVEEGQISLWKFLNNIRGHGLHGTVIPVVMGSSQALNLWRDTPIGVLFIDDGHGKKDVERDLLWVPHVEMGGFVCFHDFGAWDGVGAAVMDYMKTHEDLNIVQKYVTLLVCQKEECTRSYLDMRLNMFKSLLAISSERQKRVQRVSGYSGVDLGDSSTNFIDPFDTIPEE